MRQIHGAPLYGIDQGGHGALLIRSEKALVRDGFAHKLSDLMVGDERKLPWNALVRDALLATIRGDRLTGAAMCNLYSLTKGQAAILAFTRAIKDRTGNLPSMPGIFPDQAAPIVRTINGERELTMARWGMPSPAFALKGRATDPGVTNIRNTKSPHWRRWQGPAHRCLVPFTSFSEYDTDENGKKVPVWFAANDDRPLMAFAGFWTEWTSVRKKAEGEVTVDAFGFLTTEPNKVVEPIHPKAMPVILTEPDEFDAWLRADWKEAQSLQRPLSDDALRIVARGERKDDEG